MPAFRRIHDDQAGPGALGLLVPPGRRTVVIVRPRKLPWDLLIVQSQRKTGATTAFRDFSREEAMAATEGLAQALERWSGGSPGRVEATATALGDGYLVRAEVGIFPLLACLRQPGQPYQPVIFPQLGAAHEAATALRGVLCPRVDAEQELYFNIRHFARQDR